LRTGTAIEEAHRVTAPATFEELLAEGESEPVEGWDFSWFDGRASEERPSWRYSGLLADRMAKASAALDIQTGGAEVLAQIPHPPTVLVATDPWPPNARDRPPQPSLGGYLDGRGCRGHRPAVDAGSFDLVVSRHPTVTPWDGIARVLRPGGTYLSQGVGAGSNRELSVMGPLPVENGESSQRAAAAAEAAGLTVVDLRHEALRAVFNDIGAVVYFLRKVFWTVPDFTVDRYRRQLAELHDKIQAEGPFVAHAHRFLIEARKP
jgi:hypothetical protein